MALSVRDEAFLDELEKIGQMSPENKAKLKRWLKSTAVVAAGTGVGTGLYMIGEKVAPHVLGPMFQRLSPAQKKTVISGGAAMASAGAMLALHKMTQEKNRLDNG